MPRDESQPHPVTPLPGEPVQRKPDARLECWFCPGVESVALAPRHSGGDEDVPAHWLPVCEEHLAGWFGRIENSPIPADERLPLIPRDGIALTVSQAQELHARLRFFADEGQLDDADLDVLDTIEVGLSHFNYKALGE